MVVTTVILTWERGGVRGNAVKDFGSRIRQNSGVWRESPKSGDFGYDARAGFFSRQSLTALGEGPNADFVLSNHDESSARICLDHRPHRLKTRQHVGNRHVIQPQQHDAVAGEPVAKHQLAEILIGRQNEALFLIGPRRPFGVWGPRLDLRGEQDVMSRVPQPADNRPRHIFIRENLHGSDASLVDRFIHRHHVGGVHHRCANVLRP